MVWVLGVQADGKSHSKLLSSVTVNSLDLPEEQAARKLLSQTLREAFPAVLRWRWPLRVLEELPLADRDVGRAGVDGTVFLKVRDPGGGFYSDAFVLATFLHELTHLTHEGHGASFYQLLLRVVDECCSAGRHVEILRHVHAELINAVCDDDRPRARALLKVAPAAANVRALSCSQTPLIYAAHHGRVTLARCLLAANAKPNMTDAAGVSPLMWAAEAGNPRVAEALLAARADTSAKDSRQRTVLEHAALASEERRTQVEELLSLVQDAATGHTTMKGTRALSLPELATFPASAVSVTKLPLERSATSFGKPKHSVMMQRECGYWKPRGKLEHGRPCKVVG